jgi:C4-dicarboxylate-specific signal transduction histidine kinase
MRDINASTPDKGGAVDTGGDRAGETGGATSPNNGADRRRAAREAMASMLRDATIRTVMSTIAHDVNQPLAAVVTNANAGLRWLNRPVPDVDEVQALLARIVKDGHRAGELIAGIRAKFSEQHAEPRAVSPCEVVADVVALLGDELESHRIAVRNQMPVGLPPVLAEQARLQLALFNVVVNAIEAMASVTDRDRVLTISSKGGDADELLIAVEDSGAGIDPDSTDHLFEAFVTTKPHRAGLGLPISRRIIEAYGGRIWAKARDPYGSAFFVTLPVAAALDNRSTG